MLTQSMLLFLLMGTVISAVGKTRLYRKDYTYVEELDAFFKFHMSKVPFSDAVSTCKAEGAELFLPSSARESEIAYSLSPRANIDRIWIGLHDLYGEGTFFSLNGTSVDDLYSNWAESEPNNFEGNEDCVILINDKTFNDVSCKLVYNFVCKTFAKNVSQNIICETFDNGYVYEISLDACYKLHTTPMKWRDAFKICRAEDSHLAIINSELEANRLAEGLYKYPENKLPGTFRKDVVHLGFNDLIIQGVYVTIEGKPLSDTGYLKWAAGQPDNQDDKERCGAMDRSGTLNDVDCNDRAMFYCEKTLSNGQSSTSTASPSEPLNNSNFNVAGAIVQLPDAK